MRCARRTSTPGSRTCAATSRTTRPRVAEVLRDAGLRHLRRRQVAPRARWSECSAAGPFDQWPLQRGFDRFYGFLEGETDQFHPELVYDNHPIDPPGRPEDGYHLSEDLVDQRHADVRPTREVVRPDRPFFTYLAFGATHAPHQAPPEYLAKYRGPLRRGLGRRPRARGSRASSSWASIPEGTELAPRNPGVEPWDELPDEPAAAGVPAAGGVRRVPRPHRRPDRPPRRRAATASASSTTRSSSCIADNGASQEGGPFGVHARDEVLQRDPRDARRGRSQRIDDIGGPHSHTNYPWGWAQAGNTPFKWYKQNTHEGGVHVPADRALAGRHRRPAAGSRATSSTTSTDIVADDLRAARRRAARRRTAGVDQLPVTGHVVRATRSTDADAPTPQDRAVLRDGRAAGRISPDGWKAVTRHQPGTPTSTTSLGAVPPRRATARSATTSPATQPEQARRADRRCGGPRPRRHGVLPLDDRMHRAVRRPLPRPLAAPGRPPLRLPAADVAAARRRRPPPSAGAAST